MSFAAFRKCGDWLNRGDPLVSFIVKKPFFGRWVVACVRSPISGRLLYTNDNAFGERINPVADWLAFLCVLEVPNGEVMPPNLQEAFREFCDTLWKYRVEIFQKPPDGSFPIYSDQVIQAELESLRRTSPVVLAKSSGTYKDRVDWLNLHCPHGIGSAVNLR